MYTCPKCGGYIDSHASDKRVGPLDLSDSTKVLDIDLAACEEDDCDHTQMEASWGGSGEREIWGQAVAIASDAGYSECLKRGCGSSPLLSIRYLADPSNVVVRCRYHARELDLKIADGLLGSFPDRYDMEY